MASGKFTYNFSNFKMIWEWASTPDTSTYSSTVKVSVKILIPSGYTYSYSQSKSPGGTVRVEDNSDYYMSQFNIASKSGTSNGTEITLGTITSKPIKHNADGTKSSMLFCNVGLKLTINGKTTTSDFSNPGIKSETMVLDKLQRLATITFPTTYIGEVAKITITKPVSTYTNSLYCAFAGFNDDKIYVIAENITDSVYEWLIPEEFYAALPNAKSGSGNLFVETYDEAGNYLGDNVIRFNVLVKEETNKPLVENFTVRDIQPDILALTGDENTIVRQASMIEYSAEVSARNYATLTDQYIENGGKKISNLPQGIINNVEGGIFSFTATDSRGFTTTETVERKIIDYIKPTCYQEVSTDLSGETSAIVNLRIYGSYFNGTFGAVDNELKLEVRHTQNDGTMGDWVELTNGLIPVFNGNSYELDITISGFDYRQAYTFQCRATDKLNYVQSSQYTVKILPVFDWSETDINFNVPIGMNNAGTVLRHNAEANNTVLSGTGGHIYLRPGGTDDTTGETVIYPNGDVKFGGSVSFNDAKADFIIETGTEEMGTNGTWHWEKWASGKAVCYGRRNYGNMAITTAWGNLYRSDYFDQVLPSGLFSCVPYHISINMINADRGGWICKHENSAPSTSSTGAFIYVRPASATATKSHIGFYVVGSWKDVEETPAEPVITTITGTLNKIVRDSNDSITQLTINNVVYSVATGYTFTNKSGTGFSAGITLTATLTDGVITYWEW